MFAKSRRWPALLIAISLLQAGLASHLFGYAFEGPVWPTASTINIRLAFSGPGSGSLQDGFTTFNASAANALALWNWQLDLTKFSWTVSSIGGSERDGQNTAFFSSTVYGQTYGSAIAVTVYLYDGSTMHEADNLFNSALLWDSYRGPLQYDFQKRKYVFDFHRVAIHEFGHTLGLAHPDDNGQSVAAIMNRYVSDLDHYVDDDIAGITFLYGGKITSALNPPSVPTGSTFNYQITTNFRATSYSASGLPAGLQIYPVLGLISGAPTESGTFNVVVTANGAVHPVSATLVISVNGPVITSSLSPPSINIGDQFSYEVTATGQPISFDAINIPPGMIFDRATGVLSGVPNLSGTYHISITAHTPFGNATGVVTFVINPVPTFDVPVTTFPFGGNGPLLADPLRRRLYVGDFDGIVDLDTETLSVIERITVPDNLNGDFSISPDDNTLWFNYGGSKIGRVNLINNTLLPDPPVPLQYAGNVRQGLNNQLFVSDNDAGGVAQIDLNTGTIVHRFDGTPPGASVPNYCNLAMSPDFTTLYVIQGSPEVGIHKWDVSSTTPHLLQTMSQPWDLGNIGASHDGRLITFWTSGNANLTNLFHTSDITQPIGQLNYLGKNFGTAVFSQDDSLIFQSTSVSGTGIAVFNAANQNLVRTVKAPPGVATGLLAIDSSDTHIFAYTYYGSQHSMVAYDVRLPGFVAPPKSLTNVSTRVVVGANGNVEIGGFIVRGTQPKKVIVRAIAPSLTQFGIAGAMADPIQELHDGSGGLVAANDNWNSHRQDVVLTGHVPADEHECAIVATLAPGNYTAIVRGVNNTTGVALFELYDLDPQHSKIANISTRGNVGVGDNVMIGGFIVGGDQPTSVIVRALGPTLTDLGVTGALADPTLELHDGNGAIIAQNDNWKSTQQLAIQNSGYSPPKDAEAVVLATLQPGNYTAIVRGQNNTSGVALVEVYNLDAN
jgi:Matrixin/Putative Ig domain